MKQKIFTVICIAILFLGHPATHAGFSDEIAAHPIVATITATATAALGGLALRWKYYTAPARPSWPISEQTYAVRSGLRAFYEHKRSAKYDNPNDVAADYAQLPEDQRVHISRRDKTFFVFETGIPLSGHTILEYEEVLRGTVHKYIGWYK